MNERVEQDWNELHNKFDEIEGMIEIGVEKSGIRGCYDPISY